MKRTEGFLLQETPVFQRLLAIICTSWIATIIFQQNAIELLADAAVQKRPDFVIGNYEVTGARRWAPPLSLGTGFYEGNALVLSTYVQGKWYVMAWNKLVSRPLVLQHKLYFQEGIVHEDDLWSFKLACMSQSMYVVNETTYYYSMQPDSIIRAPSMRNLECRVLVLGYIYDFIRSSRCLQDNRLIYIYFESLKAKYFLTVFCISRKTHPFIIRVIWYSGTKVCVFVGDDNLRPEWKLMLQNIHYVLPTYAGYLYFKAFVKSAYYLLVLSIKMKAVFHVK